MKGGYRLARIRHGKIGQNKTGNDGDAYLYFMHRTDKPRSWCMLNMIPGCFTCISPAVPLSICLNRVGFTMETKVR